MPACQISNENQYKPDSILVRYALHCHCMRKEMIRVGRDVQKKTDLDKSSKGSACLLTRGAPILACCLSFLTISLVGLPASAQQAKTAQGTTSTERAPKTDAKPNQQKGTLSEEEKRAARALEVRLKARKDQETTLSEIEASIALSEKKQDELEEEIARLQTDREAIKNDMIATADRIKSLETSLTDREAKLKTLFEDQTELKVSLAEQRDSLSEILAALQRIGRNPPPALAIRPGEALDAVRSAILLSTLVPEIRLEAMALATQLEELIALQEKIEKEKTGLRDGLKKLGEEQKRLNLLVAKKQEQEEKTRLKAKDEQDKMRALAARARSLQELIDGMEQEIEAARMAVKEAKAAERRAIEQKIETKKQKIAALKNAARLSPAIPFPKMKGLLRLPAHGTVIKRFGSGDGFGGANKGLSLATRASAQVTSPADGWIVYAGPFRSFGKLLIINAGDGYHIVLAGLETLFADVGSFVLANEPVGQMQKSRLAAKDLLDAGKSRPVLYMELRKDGVAIDPAPWWTVALEEKADG